MRGQGCEGARHWATQRSGTQHAALAVGQCTWWASPPSPLVKGLGKTSVPTRLMAHM